MCTSSMGWDDAAALMRLGDCRMSVGPAADIFAAAVGE